jgi:peroxiredoxin
MPDFTLPAYIGEDVILSDLKGKNVLLIFPRGLAGEDHWCHVCNYQYAELVDLEQRQQIRKRHNLEILFVLPYSRGMVKEWIDKFPDQLADIENWRNPADPEKLDETGKRRMRVAKKNFPVKYAYEPGKVPTPFPILIDAERTVTKGLGIFAEEWSGRKVDQNIPTILILDKKGTVQFKYMSQNTLDRPSADYLLRVLETMSKLES